MRRRFGAIIERQLLPAEKNGLLFLMFRSGLLPDSEFVLLEHRRSEQKA
jgi:hypothetical protein